MKMLKGTAHTRGKVYEFHYPYWHVRYPDGEWEELSGKEARAFEAASA